jgi:hypothetical protein
MLIQKKVTKIFRWLAINLGIKIIFVPEKSTFFPRKKLFFFPRRDDFSPEKENNFFSPDKYILSEKNNFFH